MAEALFRAALKGRKVTCFHSIKDDVTNAGGTYVDQEVCIDGNVITSQIGRAHV